MIQVVEADIARTVGYTLHDTTKGCSDVIPDFDTKESGVWMLLAQEISSA